MDPVSMIFEEITHWGDKYLQSERLKRLSMIGIQLGGLFLTFSAMSIPPWCILNYILPKLCPEEYLIYWWYLGGFIFTEGLLNLICLWSSGRYNRVSYWIEKYGKDLPPSERSLLLVKQNTFAENEKISKSDEADSVTAPPSANKPYCKTCNIVVVKQSHHCTLCDVCILRKDHHCFMFSTCIGLANQRYFLVIAFWGTLSSALGTCILCYYLSTNLSSPLLPFGWLKVHPLICSIYWLFGLESTTNVILSSQCLAGISLTTMACGYFVFEMANVLRGQTMYGVHRTKFTPIGENCSERLALVFGRFWMLNFIIPMYWQPNVVSSEMVRVLLSAGAKEN